MRARRVTPPDAAPAIPAAPQLRRRAVEHELALRHQQHAVGERRERAEILVDDDRGDAFGADARRASARSSARPSARGLRSPRRSGSRPDWSSARGRWSASAARRRRAGGRQLSAPLGEPREQLEDARPASSARCRRRPARAAITRFSTTVSDAEDAAPLRHEGDAAARDRLRRRRADVARRRASRGRAAAAPAPSASAAAWSCPCRCGRSARRSRRARRERSMPCSTWLAP